jgi:Cu(I)/Ag(I) efflux system protein CusF
MKTSTWPLLAAVLLSAAACAQTPPASPSAPSAPATAADHAAHHAPAATPATAPATPASEGEVRRVDREGGRVTLRHGEIRNLEMPPMTMVFTVRDKAALEQVKEGDKVRFRAVNEAGRFIVTDLEVVR